MDNLIRRALLGDKNAAKECTDKGIALPCPWCGKSVATKTDMAKALYCENDKEKEDIFSKIPIYACDFSRGGCGSYVYQSESDDYSALLAWNTRPAPPIGRCKDCAYYPLAREEVGGFVYCPQSEMQIENEDSFCSSFEPREG